VNNIGIDQFTLLNLDGSYTQLGRHFDDRALLVFLRHLA
jgi:hypothetical protein